MTTPTSANDNASSRGLEPGELGPTEPLTVGRAAHAAVRRLPAKERGDARNAALAHTSASSPTYDASSRSPQHQHLRLVEPDTFGWATFVGKSMGLPHAGLGAYAVVVRIGARANTDH